MTTIETTNVLELARLANDEHKSCREALESSVRHAINAGKHLTDAKALVPKGEWCEWVTAHFHGSRALASIYMRLYSNRHEVQDANSINTAIAMVASERNFVSDDMAREMRKIYSAGGISHGALAEMFGVSKSAIKTNINTGLKESRRRKYRRNVKAHRALVREEVSRDAMNASEAINDAYSLIRKTLQALDLAEQQAATPAARAAVHQATLRAYGAEDAITEAIKQWQVKV